MVELPAKNRIVSTASFALVDQKTGPGSPGGFRQTNHYKSSPLRNVFAILTFRQETSERAVSTSILLLCTVYSKFWLCLLFPFPCLQTESRFCRFSFRLLPR